MTREEQARLFLAGDSRCPNDAGECVYDFSCCVPSFSKSLEERAAIHAKHIAPKVIPICKGCGVRADTRGGYCFACCTPGRAS